MRNIHIIYKTLQHHLSHKQWIYVKDLQFRLFVVVCYCDIIFQLIDCTMGTLFWPFIHFQNSTRIFMEEFFSILCELRTLFHQSPLFLWNELINLIIFSVLF